MALARVVTFDGVGKEQIAAVKASIEEGPPPDDIPASEIVVLHDADAEKAIAIVYFENEEDYERGDATLSAMPSEDTPGSRTSVTKYTVAARAKA